MKGLARLLAVLSLGLSSLAFVRVRSPRSGPLTVPKLLAGALAPYLALLGAGGAALSLAVRSPLSAIAGGCGAVLAARSVRRVMAPHDGFARAFGAEWERRISPAQAGRLLPRRWSPRHPATPEPRWERDLAFWTISDSDRRLLCDLWQPPAGVAPSGLAFLYFHGSGWHYLDKDFGTRPFFRQLAAQGHVVMDVAYRLCPEVDLAGMAGDVRRAIAWMKQNGARYGVDPARVVVGGGSAGAHLALLAAYAPTDPRLTPADVADVDLSVRGVVSYYGPTDMRIYNAHAGATLGNTATVPTKPGPFARATNALMRAAGVRLEPITHRQMMQNLLGGQPEEAPAMYDLASPVTHVHPGCPPTLLLQGEHDSLVSVEGVRVLYRRLVEADVPAVYVEFPQTEHAFDVALGPITQHSPAAQAALYDVERFLALLTGDGGAPRAPAVAAQGTGTRVPAR